MTSEIDDSEFVVADFEKENQVNEQQVEQREEAPPMPKRPFNHIKEAWGVLKDTSLDALKLQYAKLQWIKNHPGKPESEFDPEQLSMEEIQAYRESPEWQEVRLQFRQLIEQYRADLDAYSKKWPVEYAKQMEEKLLKKVGTKRRVAEKEPKEGSKKAKGSKGKDRVEVTNDDHEETVQHVNPIQTQTSSSSKWVEYSKICKSWRSQNEDHLERIGFLFHN
jgi:hypothetical protein